MEIDEFDKIENGRTIFFKGEKYPYTIKANNDRYVICTKPFNLKHTVMYTIIDFAHKWRSTNDRSFNPYDYTKQEDIDTCLKDLVSGKIGLFNRNAVEIEFYIK